ncbi:MAG: hypothetical protein AB7O13_09610, partial [Alphaproteobacteria bacterium]
DQTRQHPAPPSTRPIAALEPAPPSSRSLKRRPQGSQAPLSVQPYFDEIARNLTPKAHAILVLD